MTITSESRVADGVIDHDRTAPNGGWESLLEGEVREALERQGLPEFFKRQRWYAGKARELESARIVEAANPQGFPEGTLFFLVETRYRDGHSETYFVPTRLAGGPDADWLTRERPAGSSPGSTAPAAIACCMTAWPILRSARPCSTRSTNSA